MKINTILWRKINCVIRKKKKIKNKLKLKIEIECYCILELVSSRKKNEKLENKNRLILYVRWDVVIKKNIKLGIRKWIY